MEKYEVSKSGRVTYCIDEANRTVTATIFCNKDEPYHCVESQLYKSFLAEGAALKWVATIPNAPEKYSIKAEYVGKAVCHPGDMFDAEVGKRLALLRAQVKYNRAAYKVLSAFWHDVFQVEKRMFKLSQNAFHRYCGVTENLYTFETSLAMTPFYG